MEIRVLRYFLTVAREETISGAAQVLHITQPTLSRQIRELEKELGKKLLERGTHKVTLTKEGRFLRKRAEEIVAMVDKTQGEFHTLDTEVAGDIYIGCAETEVFRTMADVAAQIQKQCPGISFHLDSGNYRDVTEQLDKGLLDFGVLIGPFSPRELEKYETLPIPEEEISWVLMRKDNPLAQKDCIRREDLRGQPLILPSQVVNQPEDNEYRRWFGEDFEKLHIVGTFNLIYNAALMVEAGMGCLLTIGRRVDTSSESALCFRPMEPKITAQTSLVWKKYQVFSDAAEIFLGRMREILSDMPAAGVQL